MQNYRRRRVTKALEFRDLEGNTRIGEMWVAVGVPYGQQCYPQVLRKNGIGRLLQPHAQSCLAITEAPQTPITRIDPSPSSVASLCPSFEKTADDRDTQAALVIRAIQGNLAVRVQSRH